ncbi:MAG: RNA polymerase sigma factor [Planctomycetota bacterium]|nr:RNA polymerase sigma factor [Planctomycetaceae bacterium]MDQ3329062.1 RNA polymerase sigma factor [Planctomycetota bacterium]
MNAEARQQEVSALVDAHYAVLYRYAYRLSGSAADAEDLTQQAFLTAQEKLDQLRIAENAKAWLFAIVRNAYLKTRRGPAAAAVVPLQNIAEPSQHGDGSPDLTGEELTQLLSELPEDFRAPLVLFYFEDMSYRDIAAVLDLPIGTIMSRLSRGKAHLRQRLAEPETASVK